MSRCQVNILTWIIFYYQHCLSVWLFFISFHYILLHFIWNFVFSHSHLFIHIIQQTVIVILMLMQMLMLMLFFSNFFMLFHMKIFIIVWLWLWRTWEFMKIRIKINEMNELHELNELYECMKVWNEMNCNCNWNGISIPFVKNFPAEFCQWDSYHFTLVHSSFILIFSFLFQFSYSQHQMTSL